MTGRRYSSTIRPKLARSPAWKANIHTTSCSKLSPIANALMEIGYLCKELLQRKKKFPFSAGTFLPPGMVALRPAWLVSVFDTLDACCHHHDALVVRSLPR